MPSSCKVLLVLFVISNITFGVDESEESELRSIEGNTDFVFPDEQVRMDRQYNLSTPVLSCADFGVSI